MVGFFLKLNKSLGNIDEINIIAIPLESYEGINQDIIKIIEELK